MHMYILPCFLDLKILFITQMRDFKWHQELWNAPTAFNRINVLA